MITTIRARQEGMTGREGVAVMYQVFGEGRDAIMLLPSWAIGHSAGWERQVAHLARTHTVVTFDPRGNGGSDRPSEPAAYTPAESVLDALDVLDAAGVGRAVLVSSDAGTVTAALLAAAHPARTAAVVFIGSTLPLVAPEPDRSAADGAFEGPLASDQGGPVWPGSTRHAWQRDWWGFLEVHAAACLPEADSAPFVREIVEMGLGTTWGIAAASFVGGRIDEAEARRIVAGIGCPALVIHGAEDAVAPLANGIDLARSSRAGLHILPGAGHHPESRHAAQTAALIEAFLHRNGRFAR